MSIPDLELTARLVGLPVVELWSRYVAVGGSSPLRALTARMAGGLSWSAREELFLAVALNDALIEDSIVALEPLAGFVGDAVQAAGHQPRTVPPAVPEVRRTEPVRPPREDAPDLEALRSRSRDARALARRLRCTAQAARQRTATATGHRLVTHAPQVTCPSERRRQLTDACRLDSLLQGDAHILWRADASGRMQRDSASWRTFTGQSTAESVGAGWLDAVHPADRGHAEENWRACVAGEVPVRTHVRLWSVAANDWQLTRVRAVPVHDAHGRTSGWVGTNTVIGSAARRAPAPTPK
jgi:PAS domain-containing protein